MGEGLKEILKKLDEDDMKDEEVLLEENLKEIILDFIAEKYGVHELTAEIEDTVEEIFAKIKNKDMYKLEEFCDEAIIGHTHDASKYVYDYDQCTELFMARERWSEEEAIEWMEYNVVSQNLVVFIHKTT
jgi:hypothetical protein